MKVGVLLCLVSKGERTEHIEYYSKVTGIGEHSQAHLLFQTQPEQVTIM